jgi:hypothetical protein
MFWPQTTAIFRGLQYLRIHAVVACSGTWRHTGWWVSFVVLVIFINAGLKNKIFFKFQITDKSNYNYFGCTIAFAGFEYCLKTIIVINCLVIAPRVSIISKLINTRTSIIQHLYREIVKFPSKIRDLASLLVNGLLSYPGIYPNVYIASHVMCVTRSLKYICFVCIYVFTNSD